MEQNAMNSVLKGYVLFEKNPILIKGYVLFISALGFGVSLWADTTVLMMLSAFMIGAYMSPILPIWKDVESDADKRIVAYRKSGFQKQFRFYYWLFPLLIITLSILAFLKELGLLE
jgi:hypothetical protein